MIFDQDGQRTPAGWLTLGIVAALWFLAAWALPPLGYLAAVICLVCTFLDMGMNGARYTEFAPFNLAGAVLALAGAGIGES